jgi:hypothetical protein
MAQPNINQKPGQEGMASKQTKDNVAPRPQPEKPLPLSKRGDLRVSDLSWKLRSNKSEIYRKYGIPGKEVEEFANNLKEYDTSGGGFLRPSESTKLEEELKNKATSHGDTKSKKWLEALSDPEIFNK